MADPVELTPPTQNFRIFYDPSLTNALANALQFARTVESDFRTLARWFKVNDGFGPNNRTTVNLIYKDGSGSNNRGYHDDGSTTLNLNGAPSGTAIAQIIRMHFVAEFSEVLMDYNNQHGPTTWSAGSSHGEGLSQFCAYMMAPAGYNDFYGPGFENSWLLTANRPNWVDNTEATDGDVYSYGCALLYLFYLHTQRSCSVPSNRLSRTVRTRWPGLTTSSPDATTPSTPSASCSAGSIRTASAMPTCRWSIRFR
jgi:hypothetical protein